MVSDGQAIAALTFLAADVLLERFEAGFNFPACTLILNDLRDREV